MTNANTIAEAIRDTLRDIAALVTELGDEDRIVAYSETEFDDVDIFKVIAQLEPGTVMVLYNEWSLETTGPFTHYLSIVIRPRPGQTPADLQDLIINGVPTGGQYGGRPFQLQQLTVNLDPMQFKRGGRRTVYIGEDSRFTYWEMNLIVREAGLL